MTASTEERKSGVEANWQEHRREQLRRWAALPLREQLAAVEEMGELARRIQAAPVVGAVGSAAQVAVAGGAVGDTPPAGELTTSR
ncbi:hypothetical protein BH24GEM3_BH24GEM3_02490 [soil metagenome]